MEDQAKPEGLASIENPMNGRLLAERISQERTDLLTRKVRETLDDTP